MVFPGVYEHVGYIMLNDIVSNRKIIMPDEILNELRITLFIPGSGRGRGS